MVKATTLLIAVLIATVSHAQSDETAIKNVVQQLFDGMLKSDSSMVRSTFGKNVTMATVTRNKNKEVVLHRESALDGFLKAVAAPKAELWHEEIWNLQVQTDGDFATAWCDYAFYVGKSFSHCGVDAFQLYKTTEGWKIFHLADTRRKEPCDIPDAIRKKYQ